MDMYIQACGAAEERHVTTMPIWPTLSCKLQNPHAACVNPLLVGMTFFTVESSRIAQMMLRMMLLHAPDMLPA